MQWQYGLNLSGKVVVMILNFLNKLLIVPKFDLEKITSCLCRHCGFEPAPGDKYAVVGFKFMNVPLQLVEDFSAYGAISGFYLYA